MPEPETAPVRKRVAKLKLKPKPKLPQLKPKPKLPPNASDMEGSELWDKLQQIGFSQSGFARTICVNGATVRNWIGGRAYVPQTIAILVNLMIDANMKPETLGPANRNEPNR